MTADCNDPTLAYTLPFQLTPTIHRKVPDILQPERAENKAVAQGKIVVITGGGTGIGAVSNVKLHHPHPFPYLPPTSTLPNLTRTQAIARVWARAGAEGIVLSGRRKEKLDDTVQSLEALAAGSATKTKFLAVQADVSKEADTNTLFEQVTKTFGRTADVVFANAGMGPVERKLAEEDVRTWWHTFVSRVD